MHQCRSHPAPIFVMRPGSRVSPLPAAGFHEYMLTLSALTQNKQRWAWLALRTARDQYLQHFGRIGTGDILALAQEIEKEKAEREKAAAAEAAQASVSPAPQPSASGSTDHADGSGVGANGNGAQVQKDAEGDVKMDDR